MTASQPTHADPDPQTPRGRRAALTAGATAAIGALGVVLARPAEAKAGSPLLLGRSNISGSSGTLVSSTSTTAAFSARCTAGSALIGDTTSAAKWAVYGRNLASRAGAAGAVRGDGHGNVGVLGSTTNRDQYGIVA